jgi:Photosynthesis affected mutant 68
MSEKTRKSLPFEPTGNEKPGAKPKRPPIVMNKPDPNPAKLADSRIPDVVSRRMIQRALVCCGLPTVSGMGVFIGAYLLAANGTKLPNVVVLLVSMACLGLGVAGLTYGILSASWDDESGSFWGLDEFKLNFERMKEGYRANKDGRRTLD